MLDILSEYWLSFLDIWETFAFTHLRRISQLGKKIVLTLKQNKKITTPTHYEFYLTRFLKKNCFVMDVPSLTVAEYSWWQSIIWYFGYVFSTFSLHWM